MNAVTVLRIVIKLVRVILAAVRKAEKDGTSHRREILMALVLEGLKKREAAAMRDLVDDAQFLHGVELVLDGVLEIRRSAQR